MFSLTQEGLTTAINGFILHDEQDSTCWIDLPKD
jgi:hypothetical protein